MLTKGQIVKGLSSSLAEIVSVKKIHGVAEYTVVFVDQHTNLKQDTVLSEREISELEIVSKADEFSFGGDPEAFRLHVEAQRITNAFQFDPLFAVNCSVIDPLPHQVEAVYQHLLPQPQIRFLLADDTGAGKTIMTGLLLKELLGRELIERILLITPGGLTKQWQEDELGLKFNLPFTLVNRGRLDSDPYVFTSADKIVTSIDFIRNEDVLLKLRETNWDIIVVDEAHKLSAYDYGKKQYRSKRYESIQALSKNTDHLLLLTATPHRGRVDTFKNLLQLLDEDIFASESLVADRIKELSSTGVNKFFVRRLKEDMKDWNGKPLFKNRATLTAAYKLTTEEKELYDAVTAYLEQKQKEAADTKNIHVTLALMVMQRRLTSSVYAIKRTLENRYKALKDLLALLNENPSLFRQKLKLEEYAQFESNPEMYDEMDDEEREQFEAILSDPRKFKLFTTASTSRELADEAEQLKALVQKANELYNSPVQEEKLQRLRKVFDTENVFSAKEKLVLFTEHKDTLNYLEEQLTNMGFEVETIHGGKNVDERRRAQDAFAKDAQILLATDAAGEGINLQFCRLLINWDIPWNPNRLEQRMGRIHRYGQQEDVLVVNMVADNTREGAVLKRLLEKLEIIREQIGEDRVYDVISDVFEGVDLKSILAATFRNEENEYSAAIEHKMTKEQFKKAIKHQSESVSTSEIDYSKARHLKNASEERRLQPIYIQKFFFKAVEYLGGNIELAPGRNKIYRFGKVPEGLRTKLKAKNFSVNLTELFMVFDKKVFLNEHSGASISLLHFINPGNPVYEAVAELIQQKCHEATALGTVLISPTESEPYFAYFLQSRVQGNSYKPGHTRTVDEKVVCVTTHNGQDYQLTSAAKFIDLYPPARFAKQIEPPAPVEKTNVQDWTYVNLTSKQFQEAQEAVDEDINQRLEYVEDGFTEAILMLQQQILEEQNKLMKKETQQRKDHIAKLEEKVETLKERRVERRERLANMKKLHRKMPEVKGCAYVVPLSEMEFENNYGMQREDEVEAIAMQVAMKYEEDNFRVPKDVSADNLGYDIASHDEALIKRYIEVKGRSAAGPVMLSENEINRLGQLGDSAWLYIVTHCKSEPKLFVVQNPVEKLTFEQKSKGVQYLLPEATWKAYATSG